MRIIEMTAKNFKALKAIDIDASAAVITLAGDNGSGKTSVLQALASALGGKEYQPARPVHGDATRAEVGIVLDDGHKISLRVQPDGARTLEIRAPDGAQVPQPQRWLDGRIGALSFNPLAFMSEKPRQQAEMLRKAIGLDLTAIDNKIAAAEGSRLLIGRERDKLKGAAAILPRYQDVPAQEVSAAEVYAQIGAADSVDMQRGRLLAQADTDMADAEKADAQAASLRGRLTQRESAEAKKRAEVDGALSAEVEGIASEIAAAEAEIARLTQRIATLRTQRSGIDARREAQYAAIKAEFDERARQLDADADTADARAAECRTKAERARAEAAAMVTPDKAALKARLAEIQATNDKIRGNAAAATADAAYQRAEAEYTEANEGIEQLRRDRLAMIRAVKMPVEGMSFDDDGLVIFNGRPLSDASHAQQVRVCMAIAVCGNPQLRICLIDEANSLDRKSLALLCQEAQSQQLQVWMARIDGGPGAVQIEDGLQVSL